MIIDGHCHVWPDALAKRVLATKPAGLTPVGDGTLSGLLATMDAAGVDMSCCLAIADRPEHVPKVNAFIGSIDRERFIPFGTVHTGLTIEQNLASLRDNGLRAVKFHPNFQSMSLGDPQVAELMTALADEGIVVLTHAGAGSDEAAHERGHSRHVRTLVDRLPHLTLIACHYGGYHRMDEARANVVGSRAVLETSWPPRLADVDPGALRSVVARHGADRIVFGSDWPMADPAAEIAAIRSLGLPSHQEQAILGGNIARLLGLAPAQVSESDDLRGVRDQ